MRSKRARWWWAASAFMASGCTAILGLDKDYHPLEGGGGDTGDGAGSGSSSSSDGGDSGGRCTPGEERCSGNLRQQCNDDGEWDAQTPCPAEAPVCRKGACTSPPSCDGLPATCGPKGNESCCESPTMSGGTFDRSSDPAYPATVSGFRLDRFEVTVGRFRRFVEAYPGSQPLADAGAHPGIQGSGWDPAWSVELPPDEERLRAELLCYPDELNPSTWSDEPGDSEDLPITCLTWFEAFAFCAWDGGRLPTEAEWNYAAAGGDEQREYPWSVPPESTDIDPSRASYECGETPGCTSPGILPVGLTSPAGDGRWGQSDLAGNVAEWVLDWYLEDYENPCDDCAKTTTPTVEPSRVVRGGSWLLEELFLASYFRDYWDPPARHGDVGVRCARPL